MFCTPQPPSFDPNTINLCVYSNISFLNNYFTLEESKQQKKHTQTVSLIHRKY